MNINCKFSCFFVASTLSLFSCIKKSEIIENTDAQEKSIRESQGFAIVNPGNTHRMNRDWLYLIDQSRRVVPIFQPDNNNSGSSELLAKMQAFEEALIMLTFQEPQQTDLKTQTKLLTWLYGEAKWDYDPQTAKEFLAALSGNQEPPFIVFSTSASEGVSTLNAQSILTALKGSGKSLLMAGSTVSAAIAGPPRIYPTPSSRLQSLFIKKPTRAPDTVNKSPFSYAKAIMLQVNGIMTPIPYAEGNNFKALKDPLIIDALSPVIPSDEIRQAAASGGAKAIVADLAIRFSATVTPDAKKILGL